MFASRMCPPIVVLFALACLLIPADNASAAETTPSVLWNVTFGSSDYDDSLAVAIGPDGHPVVAGQSCAPDFSDCNFRMVKLDSDSGAVLWTQTFDSGTGPGTIDFGQSVAIGGDGHPVVAGASCNASFTSCVSRVIKYDGATGALLWTITYDSPAMIDLADGVAIGPDGKPIVTGSTCSAIGVSCEIPVFKLDDQTGAVVWEESFSSARGHERAFGIAVGPDGDAVVAAQSCESSDLTDCDVRTLKYDASGGAPIWNVLFDSGTDVQIGSEGGIEVSIGPDGNPVVGGYSCFPLTDCDVRAIKFDGLDGDILWNVTLNSSGTNYDDIAGVSVGSDGHAVVTGSTCPTQFANCDFVTMKLNGATGATMWSATFAGPDNDQAFGVAVGDDGNPTVTGVTCGADCQIRAIKYLLNHDAPAGTNVETSLNGGAGEPNGVDVTFAEVVTPGTTSMETSVNGPPAPSGFSFIGTPSLYFDISTTAVFVAPIEVCFNYSAQAFSGPESDLKLFHFEDGSWVDVTTSLDTGGNVICGNVSSLSPFAVGEPGSPLTSLGPAAVWVGLKNSDAVGIRFDLRAEVYRDGNQLVGSGQLDSVPGGSSGFNNARLNTIPLMATGQPGFASGATLSIKLFVRNACVGSGKNSGTARLWFNDAAANSRFDASIDGPTTYYLRDGFVLGTAPGSGPKKTIDVSAGQKCSPFKVFGTWTTTIP